MVHIKKAAPEGYFLFFLPPFPLAGFFLADGRLPAGSTRVRFRAWPQTRSLHKSWNTSSGMSLGRSTSVNLPENQASAKPYLKMTMMLFLFLAANS